MSINSRENDNHRVVITGMGVLTTIGENIPEFLQALQVGRSGVTRWKAPDDRLYSKIGGDMGTFNLPSHFYGGGTNYPYQLVQRALTVLRMAPLSSQLAVAAGLQAYVNSGLIDEYRSPERVGHLLAGHNFNNSYINENVLTYQQEPEFVDPLFGMMFLDTNVLSQMSELLGLQGPSYSVGGACASGNLALMAALDLLRSGRVDVVLVTGGPFTMGPASLQSWAMMNVISSQSFNEEPTRASRPFDRLREGFVPSEGAAAVVLESLTSARARGARIHAELMGAASTSDASRPTKLNRDAEVRVMRAALRDARVGADQIDYVNAHATSSRIGDAVEVAALKAVLRERAHSIPVNSTKSLIGHCITSSGIIDLVATVLQMEHGFVHPTINQEERDPELDLDFVPNQARDHRINFAMSNAFGFGGLNSSVVVGMGL